MKKPDSPCYKCKDRKPGCHTSCEKYKYYKLHIEDYAKWQMKKDYL